MIEFWHWWIAAVLLGALETVATVGVFLWLGADAGVVGTVLLVYPEMPWQQQFLLFAMLAIGTLVGVRLLARRSEAEAEPVLLNRRAEQYIGTFHTLETAIINGRGRAMVGDTSWAVEGPDLPAGAKVKVVGVDGVLLLVEEA